MTPIRHKNGTFYDGTAALNTSSGNDEEKDLQIYVT
jgi:hypothetical protein